MEGDLLGLNLAVLDIDLVATQHNRNVLADANKITMPVGNVLVSETRSHIEHDDGSLALNVIGITQTTKLLL